MTEFKSSVPFLKLIFCIPVGVCREVVFTFYVLLGEVCSHFLGSRRRALHQNIRSEMAV